MRRSGLLCLVLAVLVSHGAHALEMDVLARGSGGTHAAVQEGLGAGFQAAFSAGGTAQAIAACGLGGGLTLQWDYALASPVRDLVSYRGYTGVRLALYGAWRLPERTSSPLSPGVRAGVLGCYLRYSDTQLRFVAPGAFLEPTLNLWISRVPWLCVGFGIPLVWTRRADLRLSCEIGFAVEAGVRIPFGGGQQ